jgi:hypothetical protein
MELLLVVHESYLDEIPLLLTLFEQMGSLPNVRIDPDTDLQSTFFETLDVSDRIWKQVVVKFEVAPLVGFHPKGIEVKGPQWNVSISKAI